MTAPLHAVSIAGVQPSAWPPDDAMCLAGCERDSAGPGALVGGGLYCSFIELLAVDGSGNVFVSDFNNRVQKFVCP
jgi:hypothetical protein